MVDLLSLSRAARLAGVSRGELQQRIRRGEIETFEGQVRIGDLLRLYPRVSLDQSGLLEQVERIKAEALPRGAGVDTRLPSPDVLVSRLRALSEALTRRVATLEALNDLLDTLRMRLIALAESPAAPAGPLAELIDWLDRQRETLARAPETDPRHQLFVKDHFLRLMAASVKLIPSGHDFLVEGTDSILEAALRSGVRLDYGCSNGNCGACKARVISGEVWKTRDHDYPLGARERQLGYILTCCHTAVTDLVLEAAEALSCADLPRQEIQAQIRRLERHGERLMLLHARTPRAQRLRFMAGQRARLRLDDGSTAELPIASCPCNGRDLLFYVRRGGDAFSAALFDRPLGRAPLLITGPYGEFVLREDHQEPTVFIAIDDGIAPIRSLIEHAVSIDSIPAYRLYWSAPASEDHARESWCRALADALDQFAFTPLLDASPRDLLALLAADLDDWNAARFYLAGPAGILVPTLAGLRAAGLDDARVAFEMLDGHMAPGLLHR